MNGDYCTDDKLTIEHEGSVPSFYEYYCHLMLPWAKTAPNPSEYLVQALTQFLAQLANLDFSFMLEHVYNIVQYFALDEESMLLSLITLHRYIKAAKENLKVSTLSDLFSMLTVCIVLALKGLNDAPLNFGLIARELQLDQVSIYEMETTILSALDYNLFYTEDDAIELSYLFPSEGMMLLSYSNQKSYNLFLDEPIKSQPSQSNVTKDAPYTSTTTYSTVDRLCPQFISLSDSYSEGQISTFTSPSSYSDYSEVTVLPLAAASTEDATQPLTPVSQISTASAPMATSALPSLSSPSDLSSPTPSVTVAAVVCAPSMPFTGLSSSECIAPVIGAPHTRLLCKVGC
ncbi:uncharacterized protein MONOS_3410 [Monocercomonoides exilis]|uniref:uncharacterized protein n=1 Tax=Monocercomonoides exilis TaxID=2049356 RepID=UPI003559DC4E|nr:hypothetical protein MONOS_3410 [Monocercomonoides exilis]|eukprot:MONOS_3410.1-p1 / transcript=MONOS_3410.1 / gene=MONOS_3410 / organism=Monocercomonoides_exilis_PA203 / gene_product=unspecified product / transcript_product=unspecified product / location=Mono_scaffold00080:65508-66680(-) / protein_length=344 / sequence_SO=supercontig / SO=protein_coding / is_pseudo=false